MRLFPKPADPAELGRVSAQNADLHAELDRLRLMVDTLQDLLRARVDVSATLAVRQHEVGILKAETARLQANFDWLASHVNTITLERSVLFDKVLHVTFPAVPVIAHELPGADGAYQPTPPQSPTVRTHPDPNLGDILARAREIEAAARRGVPIDRDGPLGLSFEDMGDEAAAAAGLAHADDGTVVTR